MSCCDKISIKIVPRSLQKQLSNQHPNSDRFRNQLGPMWGGFGGAKMGPSWHQIAAEIDFQNYQKNDHISDRSWNCFWAILGPNLAPERRNFCLQIRAFKVLGAILGTRWAQEPAKTPQDLPPKCSPKTNFKPQNHGFGAPTGWIWCRFGWMSVLTWSDIWYNDKILVMPWCDRGTIRAHGRLPKALRYGFSKSIYEFSMSIYKFSKSKWTVSTLNMTPRGRKLASTTSILMFGGWESRFRHRKSSKYKLKHQKYTNTTRYTTISTMMFLCISAR